MCVKLGDLYGKGTQAEVFENRVLRIIFEPKRDKVKRGG